MLRAVLFDLDDTLLGNSMETFLPAYFEALTRHLQPLVPPERLLSALRRGTQAMNGKRDHGLTNEEAFASVFYPALEPDPSTMRQALDRFYTQTFPHLRELTNRRSEARLLVEWAVERQLQVVVATNPLFPRVAVEERLAWAGVPVDEFDYALVTTYETMHATKSHRTYYHEILERLGRRAEECLMVGDSWEMDVVPASATGIHAYWISQKEHLPEPRVSLAGQGTLAQLWASVATRGSLLG